MNCLLLFSQIQSITDSSRGSIRRKNPHTLRPQHSAEGGNLVEKTDDKVNPFEEKTYFCIPFVPLFLKFLLSLK